MEFADLHVHAGLPFIGSLWRRARGFPLPLVDGTSPAGSPRLHVIAVYQTFLLRRAAARERTFAAVRRLAGLPLPAGGAFIRRAADLAGGYREGYLIAVESLRHFSDPADLARLRDLGVRSLQPVHFLDMPWGRSSREGLLPPSRKGLSGLGREMIDEMGRLGLILDIAHMNDATAEESLARHKGPVLCSHTGLRELRPSARNLSAALAREIFRRGGAVGVTCWRFLLPRRPAATERLAWTRAICDTAAGLADLFPGARVAAGSDRGAPIASPAWLYSPSHLAALEAGLAERGFDAAGRKAFLSGNALAFLRDSLPA